MSVGVPLFVFGLIWTCMSSLPLFMGLKTEDGDNPIVMLIVFIAIGLIILTIGLINIIKALKLKKLAKTGKDGIGKYISHSSNVTVNGIQMYFILFSYALPSGEVKEQKTQSKYRWDQARYFQELGEFKIKYDENNAVIVEPIKLSQLHNMNKSIKNEVVTIETTYSCSYCGNTQKHAGKCDCCGARVDKNN